MLAAIAPAQEVSEPVVRTWIQDTEINPYLAEHFLQAVYAWLLKQETKKAELVTNLASEGTTLSSLSRPTA